MAPLRFLSYSTFYKYNIQPEWHKISYGITNVTFWTSYSLLFCSVMKITQCYCCIRQIFMIYSLSIERFILIFEEFISESNFLIWKIFFSRFLLLTSFDWFRYKLKNVTNLRVLPWKAFKSLFDILSRVWKYLHCRWELPFPRLTFFFNLIRSFT